jgi:hypothetical protein
VPNRLSPLTGGYGEIDTVREIVGQHDSAADDIHLSGNPFKAFPRLHSTIDLRRDLQVIRLEQPPGRPPACLTHVDHVPHEFHPSAQIHPVRPTLAEVPLADLSFLRCDSKQDDG